MTSADEFECASCLLVLAESTFEPMKPLSPMKPSMESTPVAAKSEGTNSKEEKRKRRQPGQMHDMKMIMTTAKSRPVRCEECKAPFKKNGAFQQRFFVGNYGPRPFFRKEQGWLQGSRNYYFCVKKACLETAKQDIKGDDINISEVKNFLTVEDCSEFERQGIKIVL